MVNSITIVHIVKLAKSHYFLLSFLSTVHCLFLCLFKLFVCILIFCYHLWSIKMFISISLDNKDKMRVSMQYSSCTCVQGPPRLRAIVPRSIRPCGRLTESTSSPLRQHNRLIQPQPNRSTVGDRALLLLVPRSGTVCHRKLHQRHHWTPFAGV